MERVVRWKSQLPPRASASRSLLQTFFQIGQMLHFVYDLGIVETVFIFFSCRKMILIEFALFCTKQRFLVQNIQSSASLLCCAVL